MNELTSGEFDETIRKEKTLILFFYRKNDACSILCQSAVKEIEGLIGKDFNLYTVDADQEESICQACSVNKIPTFISIKNSKIYKRSEERLNTCQILALLR